MNDETVARGQELARAYFGGDVPAEWEELNPDLARMTAAFAFGELWSRDALPVRDRAMIALAITATLRAHGQLEWHVRGALRAGLSAEEIRETLISVAGLAGFPAAWSALAVAEPVLVEADAT
jgi:4-carboxymuconolactone decarboxylase